MLTPFQAALLVLVEDLTPTLSMPSIASTTVVSTPTVTAGPVTVSMPAITSTVVMSPPTLGNTQTLSLPVIASTVVMSQPTLIGTGNLSMPLKSSSLVMSPPTLTAGAVGITLPHIAATTQVRVPTIHHATDRVEVSGRKLLRGGVPFHIKAMSSWMLGVNLSNADITTFLEDVADLGYNAITVGLPGMVFTDHPRFENLAGDDFFTGTPISSTLGTAWTSYDHIMDECIRLNLVVILSLYTGYHDGAPQGVETELIAAGTSGSYDYGTRVGARYASYDNIILHIGADWTWNYPTNPSQMVDAFFHGWLDSTTGDYVILAEPQSPTTSYTQFIQYNGTSPSGYEWARVTVNSVYDHDNNQVENFEAVWTQSGATAYPVWNCEPSYVGSPWPSAATAQQMREQIYAEVLEGGCGINFGSEHICTFGADTPWVTNPDWVAGMVMTQVLETAHAWDLIDGYVDNSLLPGAWVTTGVGSGDTKAAVGIGDDVALAYFPTSRVTAVDTTALPGTNLVRLRWFDPTNGAFTTIAATEIQQSNRSVTFPSNHGDGSSDWVLVVELLSTQQITMPLISSTVTMFGFSLHQRMTLPHIASTAVIGPPVLTPAALTISLPHIAATTTVGPPQLALEGNLSLPLITSTVVLFVPALANTMVAMPHIASTLVMLVPALTTSALANLRVGEVIPTDVKLGSDDVEKLYMGSTQIWP